MGKRNKYRQVAVVVLLTDCRLRSLSKSHKTPPTGICNGVLLHKLLITKHDVLHISNSVPWINIRKKSWCHLALTKTLQPVSVFFVFLPVSSLIFHSAAAYRAFSHAPGSPSAVGRVFEVWCLTLCCVQDQDFESPQEEVFEVKRSVCVGQTVISNVSDDCLLLIFTPEVIQKHHYMWFWTSEKSLRVLLCVFHYGTFYFNLRSPP